jgi:hypothetical protein
MARVSRARKQPLAGLAFQPRNLLFATPQKQSTGSTHLPAPVGGINTTDVATAMPPGDCLSLFNMIPFQYGLRVRSGYYDWTTEAVTVTGPIPLAFGLAQTFTVSGGSGTLSSSLATALGGGVPEMAIRTLIAFNGKRDDSMGDRLFATTQWGIWDVSTRSAPVPVFPFPVKGANSGKGSYTCFANVEGNHYIAYCDEMNGYLLYSEKTGTWSKVLKGQLAGQIWGANPDAFRHVMTWKNRLWFTEGNSQRAWYLPIGQFAGTVHPIYFGARFRYGGSLVGLYSWTIDGGQGIDDKLVAISRSGDVVVYEGTDPDIAGAFGLVGVWWAGPVPPGRKIASDFGGDLFILSLAGCVPLSKLVSGGLVRDPDLYATKKVGNLFNKLMTERGALPGWEMKVHPTDNQMIINVPFMPSGQVMQMTMSLISHGWAMHTGIPMSCMESWHGKLYFGTSDGFVCVNDGPTDAAGEINFALLSAYQNLGSARKKRVQMVKPMFITDGTQPAYSAAGRYDFDLTELDASLVSVTPGPLSWDSAVWTTGAFWGPEVPTGTAQNWSGSFGMGSNVAIVLKGSAKAETTLVGFDVLLDQGGFL